jgi:hypothetical protein
MLFKNVFLFLNFPALNGAIWYLYGRYDAVREYRERCEGQMLLALQRQSQDKQSAGNVAAAQLDPSSPLVRCPPTRADLARFHENLAAAKLYRPKSARVRRRLDPAELNDGDDKGEDDDDDDDDGGAKDKTETEEQEEGEADLDARAEGDSRKDAKIVEADCQSPLMESKLALTLEHTPAVISFKEHNLANIKYPPYKSVVINPHPEFGCQSYVSMHVSQKQECAAVATAAVPLPLYSLRFNQVSAVCRPRENCCNRFLG